MKKQQPLGRRSGNNSIKKRDNTPASTSTRRSQNVRGGARNEKRGLGDRRAKGKTLSLAPANKRGNKNAADALKKKRFNSRK